MSVQSSDATIMLRSIEEISTSGGTFASMTSYSPSMTAGMNDSMSSTSGRGKFCGCTRRPLHRPVLAP